MDYEKEFNMPLEKISDFAKYVADYYYTSKRRGKIKKNINNMVMYHLKFTLDYFNIDDIQAYLYFLDKYHLKRTIKNIDYFFEADINQALMDGKIDMDKKGYLTISENVKKMFLSRDKDNNLEDTYLYKQYRDIVNLYGKTYNWPPLPSKVLWNSDFDKINVGNSFTNNNHKLGMGYTYKKIIPNKKLWDDIKDIYFD